MSAAHTDRAERLQRIAAGRIAGRYLREIALEEGISIERVRQLLREHATRCGTPPHISGPGRVTYQRWCGTVVSTRLYNILADHCAHPPAIVRERGRAWWASRPGCGPAVLREIDSIIGEWN
ncbi:MAG: hypothetical protein M0Z28_31715 [Rhodospirillales bacterium]|nr:hypothetical protein [Rhodospirillales bacterium]